MQRPGEACALSSLCLSASWSGGFLAEGGLGAVPCGVCKQRADVFVSPSLASTGLPFTNQLKVVLTVNVQCCCFVKRLFVSVTV